MAEVVRIGYRSQGEDGIEEHIVTPVVKVIVTPTP